MNDLNDEIRKQSDNYNGRFEDHLNFGFKLKKKKIKKHYQDKIKKTLSGRVWIWIPNPLARVLPLASGSSLTAHFGFGFPKHHQDKFEFGFSKHHQDKFGFGFHLPENNASLLSGQVWIWFPKTLTEQVWICIPKPDNNVSTLSR